MLMMGFQVWLGLTIGNFIYLLFCKKKDWLEASKLSFFQAVAIGLFIYIYSHQ